MNAYEDPNDERNGPKYHTGKPCIVRGCDKPAGTAWGLHWCQKHNVERINRISASLEAMLEKKRWAMKKDKPKEKISVRKCLKCGKPFVTGGTWRCCYACMSACDLCEHKALDLMGDIYCTA